MKKQLLIYILFNIFLLQGVFANSHKLKIRSYDNSTENVDFQFRYSKIKLIKKIENIWGCTEVDLKSVILNFNEILHKDYIIIELGLIKNNIDEEFQYNVRATSRALLRHILNLKEFKGAQLNYHINSGNEVKKNSEIIFITPDKFPIIKGCDRNLNREDIRKCFSIEIVKHFRKNFKTFRFKKRKT